MKKYFDFQLYEPGTLARAIEKRIGTPITVFIFFMIVFCLTAPITAGIIWLIMLIEKL
jgi:hypothetical protein